MARPVQHFRHWCPGRYGYRDAETISRGRLPHRRADGIFEESTRLPANPPESGRSEQWRWMLSNRWFSAIGSVTASEISVVAVNAGFANRVHGLCRGRLRPDFMRPPANTALPCDNPWLAWGRHTAHWLGEARGWPRKTRLNVERALVMLLSDHADGDVIRYSEIAPVLRARGLSTVRTTEVLDHIGVFVDDRPAAFDLWLERKLDGLAVGIWRDVEGWARTLHDGGPRSRARHRATVWNYLNRIRPALSEWSSCYDHLREVTRDDVITHLDTVHGPPRQHTVVALRSLFRWAKKNGTIFKNPTLRIRVGQREEGVIQPLEPEHTSGAVAAVTHPADRLILALAAVHAARPAAIRRLQLDDLDIGNRRLTIDGRTRPLDDLTLQVACEWLEFRRRRWPDTANLHLLINKQTALGTDPIGKSSVAGPALHGQIATLERLRMHRQLEEALVHGPAPLHLAEVFGLSEKTAIRYANSARALLERPLEADPATSPRTHRSSP